jgi:hypothetical protein
MTFPPPHEAFDWIGQPALDLPVYKRLFNGAKPVIAGESPYLSAKENGVEFALRPDHTVRAAFFYSQGVEDYAQYQGPLPSDLSFGKNRADVRSALGEPAMSGEAGGTGIFALDHSFDRYEDGVHYLRFEYQTGDAAIRLITIGLCDD